MEQTRRHLLGVLGAAVAGSAAGCSGDDGEGATPTDTAGQTDASAATPTAAETATETTAPTDTPTETATDTPTATPTPTPTATPVDAAQTVAVGPGNLVFDPETFEVPVGSTVLWVWRSSGHNVKPGGTPDGSDWTGTPGDGTYSRGHEYAHTFTVAGEYEYHCVPHRSAGMTGSFTVTE
mgnify:CR=1 FL=1